MIHGILHPVDSSMLSHVGYVSDSGDPLIAYPENALVDTVNTLVVRFNDGALWAYMHVPINVFDALIDADSIGKAFHSLVRNAPQYAQYKWEDSKWLLKKEAA